MKMAFVPEISVKSTKSSFQLFHHDYGGAYYAIHSMYLRYFILSPVMYHG